MKPYANLSGKARWTLFWGNKCAPKFKKMFKKSARQESKKLTKMETTLEYLVRNYEQADNAYFDMQMKADNQSKVAEQAQKLADSYRNMQKEADKKREKYLKMILELDPNFVG